MKTKYPIISMFIALLLLPNCGEMLTEEVTKEDSLASQALVDEANEVLFDDLQTIMDDTNIDEELESDTWGSSIKESMDLSSAHQKYTEALEKDPNNKGAHFGKGFMEVSMISQDELLEITLNQWAECFKSFYDTDLERSVFNNNEYNMGIPQSGNVFFSFDALHILDYLPIITSHKYILKRSVHDCPEIDTIQDLLEKVFKTRISTAIEHLDKVVGTGFTFTITPEMMGDEYQNPIELDDTEIYLMKALMHQLRAMIYATLTYNVNIPYYDLWVDWPAIDQDWQWLAQNSDLLTIRPGQENSWPNAHADLNNVLNSIEYAWTFLKVDTDTQYDVILLDDITNLEEDMVDEIDTDINEFLVESREVLNGEYIITLDYEDCVSIIDEYGYWEDEECESNEIDLVMDIKSFLTNPPQNMKAILPSYIIETGACIAEECDDMYDDNGYWQSYECESIAWGCPEFSWEATNCADWKSGWDVTIGGLLPNMTTIKFFDDIMELDNEDCEEILEGIDY